MNVGVLSAGGERLPVATRRETTRGLFRVLGQHPVRGVAALLVLCLGVAAGLTAPWIIGLMIDDVVGDGGALLDYSIALVAAFTMGATLTWVGRLLLARLAQIAIRDVRESAFTVALSQSSMRIEAAGTGDLVARLSGDVRAVGDVVSTALPAFVGASLGTALSLAGMGFLDPRFTLAALLAAPVQYFGLRRFLRRSGPIYRAHRATVAERGQRTLEAVRGADTVAALQAEETHLARIAEASDEAIGLEVRATHVRNVFNGALNSAELVGLAAVLVVGYLLVSSGDVGLGAATAAALYFLGLFGPMSTLLSVLDELQDAGASLARLFGLIDLPIPAPRVAQAPTPEGRLDVRRLRFGYREGIADLDEISLQVAPGEHIAIVGASGAGKTTLARVLAGILPPDAGAVRHDDQDISEWHPHDLRDAVVLLSQEPHVFSGTVRDDLRLFTAADDDQVRAAIERLDASWILALPEGLDTAIGDEGHELTPGQAQHLALVRVALSDAAVVILDEATAEAGTADAAVLDAAAIAAIGERTGIVIAHRLSQAETADRIIVMGDGRILQSGTHENLVHASGPYADLWRSWTAW